ncbi:hypothetical protein D515_00264 [Grimontia indica]|uniref:Outer membrane protein beta-barrel domain-containing protein n=1 Tax=Grimontia indica TaxID=1056512 RepID=R1GX71_9GAMM|nr:porin family protein [Grimontia indica]EOD80639.1 hypothetical protein D515_00264 [Grimontia indica]
MKKMTIALVVALSAPTFASDTSDDTYLFGGYKGGDRSGFALGAGYQFSESLGFEASYAYGGDESFYEFEGNRVTYRNKVNVTYHSTHFDAVWSKEMSPYFIPFAKTGIAYNVGKSDMTSTFSSGKMSSRDSEIRPHLGLGVEMRLPSESNVFARMEYNTYLMSSPASDSWWGLNLGYRFS